MRFTATLQSMLRWLFRRRSQELELDDELHSHLEQEIEYGMASGLSREEAAWRAKRLLGSTTLFKEECRDSRRTAPPTPPAKPPARTPERQMHIQFRWRRMGSGSRASVG